MDFVAILALVQKGLTIIGALLAAGQSAAPALQALLRLVSGAQAGTVTTEELTKTEATLDAMIADFNTDLP